MNDDAFTGKQVFDLTQFTCPMNLVMAKNYFYELKTNAEAIFKLDPNNKAGIENITAFLNYKNILDIIITKQNDDLFLLFKKPNEKAKNNNKIVTKILNKNLDKKSVLAAHLQQNIKRRKGVES